jgi:FkbH-like protein
MDNRKIKCVVWDLDNTLWKGTLLEDDNVILNENIIDIIKILDGWGILQSIASKNDFSIAFNKLQLFDILDFFLYPQINWNPKSHSLKAIQESLNIGMDAIAFIDDQEYEIAEVKFFHPEVLCIQADDIHHIVHMPEMHPRFISDESKIRRHMYLHDIERKKAETQFIGSKDDFLASLKMVLTIRNATLEDLKRAEELTIRTHQLNTTGYSYSFDELKNFIGSSLHKLLVASLEDKFGTYGKIALVLMETTQDTWTIKLFLTSCRVKSRGIGSVLINYLRNEAIKNNVRLFAEFIHTDVNRMMYMTYMFSHFKKYKTDNKLIILENDLSIHQEYSQFITFD